MNTASRIVDNSLKTLSSATLLSLALLSTTSAFADMTVAQQQQAFEQGWQAMKSNDLDQAFKIWDQLSKNPSNSPELKRAIENNLAVVLMRKKQYDEAQKRLDAALQADKQVARTLDNLNQIYAYQAQQAYKKVFEKTTVKQPQGEWLFIELAQADAVSSVEQPPQKAPEKVTEPAPVVAVAKPELTPEPMSNALFEVNGLVESWRRAWSAQDVNRYLSFYDQNDFQPRGGMSYASWEKSRYRNVKNPKYIKIYLDDLKLTELPDRRVRVDFDQRYESDRFNDTIHKFLIWKNDRGDWKIVQEDVVYANP
ncbi:hypothetical protein THMIRHAS_05820 [Thiosulfatimonas sediminis]|uniref:Cds6 C-terminal domain-containing protein n=1 Tax=Thiosulfatimonas sediminis TaxID=2675054 RepID=A0A6F8PSX4_9GAMM|nr:hypothetical protein [Thiosulfatimonas sediminis]BBP45209.1 hypothetical protein THMIRHAS_05820 [Thiosulfatimonas sediminis]